jgi:hypothetical protein
MIDKRIHILRVALVLATQGISQELSAKCNFSLSSSAHNPDSDPVSPLHPVSGQLAIAVGSGPPS